MKKKAIERIGFLGLPKQKRNKGVEFVGRTEVRSVADEPHFFLEVYRNRKESKAVPVVRIVVTEKDFGTYYPAEGAWERRNIKSETGLLAWEDVACSDRIKYGQNILYSRDDEERLKSFFKDTDISCWPGRHWWAYIAEAEHNIICRERRERSERRHARRQQALEDRIENTPKLPEQEVLSWADKQLFTQHHFLYYRKKGRRAVICCSACGGASEGVWKGGDTYENQFEKHIGEPREKYMGICPRCGAAGVYKPQGKAKCSHSVTGYTFKADKYKETGAVIRYIRIDKKWQLEQNVDEKGQLYMAGACESLEGVEVARTYIYNGKIQTDFQKHNTWENKDFWDDCNLYGSNSITVGEAVLYPGFEESLRGTCLQYSAIGRYEAAVGRVNAREYLTRYLQTPQIEMLVKLKLYGVVREMVKCHYGIIADEKENRVDLFLGIRKEKVKLLIKHEGDTELLGILQKEKRMGQKWTDVQAEALAEIRPEQTDIGRVCGIMTLQKALNLIAKYAGCGYGTGCSQASGRLRNTARTYFDYLAMREQRGYDMGNTVYQRPRNLEAAHMKMVNEINREAEEKRKKEAADRYPLIRKNYRTLRKRFLYEDDVFLIRPARSAEEIIQEGRILHHCVGGDHYLRRHNDQKSIILMLRKKEAPEIPYITVEIDAGDGKIKQWYGAHDKKPDESRMQKWLNAYGARIRYGSAEGMERIRAGCLEAGA